MANLYWVGGTGTWDGTTNHFALTSGGVAAIAAPTSADDVFFDAGSGTGTVTTLGTTTDNCHNLTFTGYTGTFVHDTSTNVNVSGSLTLAAGMTYTRNSSCTWFFSSTAAGNTIDFGGKTNIGYATFNGVGGGWAFSTGFTTSPTAVFTLTNGTLDFGASTTISLGALSSNNSNTRSILLNGCALTLSGTGTVWDVTNSTNMTQTGGTSTVTANGANAIVRGALANDSNVQFNNLYMTGSGTAGWFYSKAVNFTRTGTATKTDGLNLTEVTATGTFTITGNSAINRVFVTTAHGSTAGNPTPAVVTAAAVSLTNVDFMDITGAGAAAPWTGTSLGNALGNSGITFTTPATQTWNANTTGSWSTAANWTSRVPLAQDNVAVTGLTTGTITVDMPRIGANIDFTGSTGGTLAWSMNTSIYGNLTMATGMLTSGTAAQTLRGRSAQTITSNGVAFTNAWITAAPGGTYTLQDDLTITEAYTVTAALQLGAGTFNANNHNVSLQSMVITSSNLTAVLKMGSGTWTISGAGTTPGGYTFGTGGTANWTVQAQTSTIIMSNTSATGKVFQGGGFTFNNLQINGAASSGAVKITGANTFNNITFQANSHTTLTSGTTQTVSSLTSNGSASNLAVIDASTAGTFATITSANLIGVDYVSLKDNKAANHTPFYAGNNSTNVSGNTNWTFTGPPTVITTTQSATARITTAISQSQSAIARIQRSYSATQPATARIIGNKNYSRGSYSALPTTNAALSTIYSTGDISNAGVTDGSFVDLLINQMYGVHEFRYPANSNTSAMAVSWTGKTTRAASVATVYMQIWNNNSSAWETLTSNSTAAANSTFTMSGSQGTNLSNYYDANNYIYVRVYQ